jgi:hypothetical protein
MGQQTAGQRDSRKRREFEDTYNAGTGKLLLAFRKKFGNVSLIPHRFLTYKNKIKKTGRK